METRQWALPKWEFHLPDSVLLDSGFHGNLGWEGEGLEEGSFPGIKKGESPVGWVSPPKDALAPCPSCLAEALATALHHDTATRGSLARSGAWKET